jgi:hypothetical protein
MRVKNKWTDWGLVADQKERPAGVFVPENPAAALWLERGGRVIA